MPSVQDAIQTQTLVKIAHVEKMTAPCHATNAKQNAYHKVQDIHVTGMKPIQHANRTMKVK